MDPFQWMMRYLLLPAEERVRLDEMIPVLLKSASASDLSARMATYAFLDAATGGVSWSLEREGVSSARLRELRAYDLRGDRFSEPWHLDARYGAFFGCGDAALLLPIRELARVPSEHPLRLAARWSLQSACRQHPRAAAAVPDWRLL